MAERIGRDDGGGDLPAVFRSWMMVVLTLLFVLLYASALTGWLKPLADERMITRLEPVIFVIIGYYFGRLPAHATERTLKGELARQSQKADAAQHAKEQAQRTAEALEEKVKNARATLTAAAPAAGLRADASAAALPGGDALRHSVGAALSVLNS
ncbi:MAG TPA: hypothetical protein VK422_03890 [Pyrinomonadaceae bacterium]|nr:hypothetical protein [Pyrinomonadaceae bacterium]